MNSDIAAVPGKIRLPQGDIIACDEFKSAPSPAWPAGHIWKETSKDGIVTWCNPSAQVNYKGEHISITPKTQMRVQGFIAWQKGLIKNSESVDLKNPGMEWKPRTYKIKPKMSLECNSVYSGWECDLWKEDKHGRPVNWTSKAQERRIWTREHVVRKNTIEVDNFSVDGVAYNPQTKAWMIGNAPIKVVFPEGGRCSRFYHGVFHRSSVLECKSGPAVSGEGEATPSETVKPLGGWPFRKKISLEKRLESGTTGEPEPSVEEKCGKICSLPDPENISFMIKSLDCCVDSVVKIKRMKDAGVRPTELKYAKEEENFAWCAPHVKSWINRCFKGSADFPSKCESSEKEMNSKNIDDICNGLNISMSEGPSWIGEQPVPEVPEAIDPDSLLDMIDNWEIGIKAAETKKRNADAKAAETLQENIGKITNPGWKPW